MALVNTSDYYTRLNEIGKLDNPRAELCSWLNRMNETETAFFLRYIAGWQTAEYYANRGFRSQGDLLFDTLYAELFPE